MAHPGDMIEERLRTLEDREEIRQLNQDYRRHLDARDLDAYSQLFAEDGEWLGRTGYGRGPAGIAAMLKERLAVNPGPPGPTSWHLVTEPQIELHGDRATGAVTWALVQRSQRDTPVLKLLGHYDDTYVREHGRWRYGRRVAHIDIPRSDLNPLVASLPTAAAAAAGRTITVSADESVGARLGRLEDLEQIRQLFVEYKIALDQKDFSGYAALFAEDGEFIAGPQRAKGRASIQALVQAMLGNLLGAVPGQDFHLVVNPLVELDADDADRARAQVTWVYVVEGEDGAPAVAKLGHYDDELVREAGRWRFLRREAPTDIPAT